MKLYSQKQTNEGIKATFCMCKGTSKCEPKDRKVMFFKSAQTLKNFINTLKIKILTYSK